MKAKVQQYPGELYVFEGFDDTGKTTLSKKFADFLRSQGRPCHHWAFPGHEHGTLGKVIYDYHHTPEILGIPKCNPASLQTLHVAAHIDAIEERILPALQAGDTIILDRFWWSTWVYGLADGVNKQSLKALIALEKVHWKHVKPTLLFLISRAVKTKDPLPEKSKEITQAYEDLAGKEKTSHPVHFISNNKNISDSLQQITKAMAELNKKANKIIKPPQSHSKSNNNRKSPLVFSKLAPAKPTAVYDTYWRFAAERQAIFFRRLKNEKPPWTSDPILLDHKFTNTYRASDRVSQYLIRHVIYDGDQSPEEVVFRILLFKIFNKIETWELLVKKFGTVSYRDFTFQSYDSVLEKAISQGERIYSAAYIMPTGGPGSKGTRKHQLHLNLLKQMMDNDLHKQLQGASSMSSAFNLLRSYPTIGDFLAYQFVTDLNYSTVTDFSEMDFVVPGPGAHDGLRKCFSDFGGLNGAELIKVVAERQDEEFSRLGIEFKNLWGRPLQLIDCQNIFCETDKYARVAHPDILGRTGRTRIKQRFRASKETLSVWYPPKWEINNNLQQEGHDVQPL